jgi:tRNA(Ile)-lysidine synthase
VSSKASPSSSRRNTAQRSAADAAVSSAEAKSLFAHLSDAQSLVVAVSGGPDSTALLWLAARWRAGLKRGLQLLAVTVDHGLRAESGREARAVKALAASLDIPHRTMRWTGPKPATGLAAAAREARYALLVRAARKARASHILTAHTQDDQAETFLMRLSRGSGLAGLAAMASASAREDIVLARPLLDVPKARLLATLRKAGVDFADDPTNRDPAYARPRWRGLMPQLATEGMDARMISRLVARIARANDALDAVTDRAFAVLVQHDPRKQRDLMQGSDFLSLPPEIRVRLLQRIVARWGHEGPAEFAKIENLASDLSTHLAAAGSLAFKRTLAGAMIGVEQGIVALAAAPRRRARAPSGSS